MQISSPVFDDRGNIPPKYTCDGEDISPPLKISNIPTEAKSLAIVVDDPDAPGGIFDHWTIWNISTKFTKIPENIPEGDKVDSLNGAIQGKNGFGEIGYRGPCPPPGPDHKYRFKLYALKDKIDLNPGVLKKDLERKIKGLVVKKDQITGLYDR
ncbi:hypothetical protein AKJ56_01450 [candidate division MSBL1 archaeon SCGC-AAA382N08]|uniref:Phosphatidylethanolamine-binding protein n=1 Tax=candidate division MSBL1 archaeon SCGC-AAA382N08 TaxID=1698285 RepID=A0A133VPP1_9EURY|nr:hypothetical protein AKJ56_01450 [candidate division MSBL1 archaeon SCGC-AAA382N08]